MFWDWFFGPPRPRIKPKPPSISGPVIRFGMQLHPESFATSHWAAIGATGSGKTVLQRMLMQSVLPEIGLGLDRRALVYDAKGDAMPILAAIAPQAEILTLNPFDERGVAWDLAADIREPRVALEFAHILMPREHESQPFFSDAARHLLYGTVLGMLLRGNDWTFADVLRALQSPGISKSFLKAHRHTRSIVGRYFFDKRLLSNIFSTIATKLLPFECIAASWETAKRMISLADWTSKEQILVMPNSETGRAAIDALNRAIFRRLTQLVLAQSESFTRRSWFFLDELSEAGRLEGLVSLMKKGRSKGACVMVCLQSFAGLRDEKLYGPHFAEELLAQIGNRFYGRLECPETAEAASRLFGDQDIDQYTVSHTSGKHSSTTTNHQIVTRRTVLPSEFLNTERCSKSNGLAGYYRTQFYGCSEGTLVGDELFDSLLVPPDASVPDLIPRSMKSQLLRGWKKSERQRLGLPERLPAPESKRNASLESEVKPATQSLPANESEAPQAKEEALQSTDPNDSEPNPRRSNDHRIDGIDGLFS